MQTLMRFAIATVIFGMLPALVSASASAAWVMVSVSAAGSTYVDTATIRRVGDIVTMSEMTDYKIVADSTYAYKSVRRSYEFDCKTKRFQMLSTTGYAGRMGKGDTVISADGPAAEWRQVIAGSVGEILWKVACARRGRTV